MEFDEPEPTPLAELEEAPTHPGRRPMLWGISAALVIVVAVAVILVVSGGPTTKSPTVVLSEAQGRTTSATTAHTNATETLTLNGHTSTVLELNGVEDFGRKTTSASITIGGGFREEVRAVGGAQYLSVPAVDLPGGKHWVLFTAADVKGDADAKGALGSTDPSSGLGYFAAINGNPRVVDHDALDGIKVTHYAFNLDLQSFLDRLQQAGKSLNAPGFGSALQQVKSLVDLSSIPGEAWIDGAGRVRKFDMSFGISSSGVEAKIMLELRFSHFDEPVSVEAPAASDTVPFRDVPNIFGLIAGAAKDAA